MSFSVGVSSVEINDNSIKGVIPLVRAVHVLTSRLTPGYIAYLHVSVLAITIKLDSTSFLA